MPKKNARGFSIDQIKPRTVNQAAYLEALTKSDVTFGLGAAGVGKCLGKDTPVLMFNGDVKPVQEVVVGDLLMGPDSRPRLVRSTCRGRDKLYRITPTKGDAYVVNSEHILSLKWTGRGWGPCEYGGVVNITVQDYLKQTDAWKKAAKGWRTGVDFREQEVPMDPYLLGVWLGDGNSRGPAITTVDEPIKELVYQAAEANGCHVRTVQAGGRSQTHYIEYKKGHPNPLLDSLRELGVLQNKHIPKQFKVNSRSTRLNVLAGLLDTDGSLSNNCYDYVSKHRRLAEDVCFVARSLGLAAYMTECQKTCGNNGVVGTYYRVCISGETHEIPCRLEHKRAAERKQIKSVQHTGIHVEELQEGEYFGFDITGDRLFMLGDFTVTHNTMLAVAVGLDLLLSGKVSKLVITRPVVEAGESLGFLPGSLEEKIHPYLLPILDFLMLWLTPDTLDEYTEYGIIEIAPLAYMRGRNFNNAFMILDEAQNATPDQVKMFLTRMGNKTKAAVCGDPLQSDLKGFSSGLIDAIEKLEGVEGIATVRFTGEDIQRSPIVRRIVKAYENPDE